MDEVVALSSMLRARHLQSQPTSTRLDDIPSLTRSLPQVAADSTRLLSARVAATSSSSPSVSFHPAALRLFASVGFDSDALRRAIASVPNAASFIDIPVRPPGTHRHLTSIPPRALDDVRLRTNAALSSAAHDELVADLKHDNRRLLARLSSLVMPDTGRDTPKRQATPFKKKERPDGNAALAVALSVDVRYVDVVRGIALHGDAQSAPFLMCEAAGTIKDTPHFVESLRILASVARYAKKDQPPPLHLVVWGARVVLEDQFAERIPELPQKPRLASAAAIIPAVTDYVRALHRDRKVNVHNIDPRQNGNATSELALLWMSVFYCMRIGHVQAALVVLKSADSTRYPDAEQAVLFFERFLYGKQNVKTAFSAAQRGGADVMYDAIEDDAVPMSPGLLVRETEYGELARFYEEFAWPSDDPYFRACIVLLMRLELLPSYGDVMQGSEGSKPPHPIAPKDQLCSLAFPDEDMSLLFGSVEDYMWLRLWLCQTPLECSVAFAPANVNIVSVEEIQNNMLTWGSEHFDPSGTHPLLYTFVLVCCGLYEEAVSYLISHANQNFMHPGVHMALVIYHLRWMKEEHTFHSILMRYVSLFSHLLPTEAAVYLMTIRDRQVLGQLLRDLIVATGEYDTLLNTAAEGRERPGSLSEILCSASAPLPSGFSVQDLANITLETSLHGALDAASRGEYAAAAALFKTGGNLAQCAEMTMKNLADVVDEQLSSKRPLAVAEARNILQALNSEEIPSAPRYIATSINALLKMSTFFEEFWVGRYQTAWHALRGVGVVPLKASESANYRRDLSGSTENFDSCIQRCSIEVLKLGLNIAEFALEQGHVQTGEDPPEMESCARPTSFEPPLPSPSEIKALCMFAGCVRISEASIYKQLIRIEMLLGGDRLK